MGFFFEVPVEQSIFRHSKSFNEKIKTDLKRKMIKGFRHFRLFIILGNSKNAAKLFFASVDFPELISFSFLNTFEQNLKGVLKEICGHLTYYSNFPVFKTFQSTKK